MAFDFGKILQAYNVSGGQPGGMQPMQSPIGMPPVGSSEKDAKSQKMAMLLYALGGALKGQDPLQQGMAVRKMQQQQQAQLLQKQKEEKMKQFAAGDPGLQRMYDIFGEKGLQQGYFQQLDRQQDLLESQQQIEKLKGAGFTDEEINLNLAGLDLKDIIEFRDDMGLSGQQIIQDVEENVESTIQQTEVLDTFSNLDQAFGPIDASQEALSKVTRVLGFDVDPLGTGTGAAVKARNSLNTEILANLAADFTGRPNMLIYENIKGNLPMNAATSEKDAREKYINVKDQVDARINNLKQGLKSTTVSDANKEKYRDELNKSLLLSKKLDSAIGSLMEEKKETLKPVDIISEGKYSSLYTNNDG